MYTTQMVALPMVSALSWVQMSGKTMEAQLRMGQLMLSSGLDALDMESGEAAPAQAKVATAAVQASKVPAKPKNDANPKAESKSKTEARSRKARKAPAKPPAMSV